MCAVCISLFSLDHHLDNQAFVILYLLCGHAVCHCAPVYILSFMLYVFECFYILLQDMYSNIQNV